jgi:hypothetical protein
MCQHNLLVHNPIPHDLILQIPTSAVVRRLETMMTRKAHPRRELQKHAELAGAERFDATSCINIILLQMEM